MATDATIDPVTLEVVRNKLESIANEMQLTLMRSSFSPAVKESLDASASLFTADGTTLSQATAIPIHLGTLVPAVASVLKQFPVDSMAEGDIFLLNDPYAGGTHLPDLAVIMPVMLNGRVIALTGVMTHHQDVGGMSAGSIPTNATEIFQEGIRIPPVKVGDRNGLDPMFVTLMTSNVRLPDYFIGDLNAQIAACKTGTRRLVELAEANDGEKVTALFAELLNRSEALTREAISKLPTGTFRYIDYLDNDGIDLDRKIKIEVAATVDGDNITFDFTGTSAQVRGPLNCVPSGCLAAGFFAIRALCGSSIPTNGGCFRPLKLILPEGSLVNPIEPAPVNARTNTIKIAAGCMLGCFRDQLPHLLGAPDSGDLHTIMWSGRTSSDRPFVVMEILAGGSGARATSDGVDVTETDVTNGMNLPVEAFEMNVPVRILRMEVRRDSGGTGRHRGGLGLRREYEILAPVTLVHRGERFFNTASGLLGGKSGMPSCTTIVRRDGSRQAIRSKEIVSFEPGDRLILETAGGGGFGYPAERDLVRIEHDIRTGKCSRQHGVN